MKRSRTSVKATAVGTPPSSAPAMSAPQKKLARRHPRVHAGTANNRRAPMSVKRRIDGNSRRWMPLRFLGAC